MKRICVGIVSFWVMALVACSRPPVEYKETQLKLSYKITEDNPYYSKDEVTFVVFESEEAFTVYYPNQGIFNRDKKYWHSKSIKEEHRKDEIEQNIRDKMHVISENDNDGFRLITYNTLNGVIVTYNQTTNTFTLYDRYRHPVNLKGDFPYLITFPFDGTKEMIIEEFDDHMNIYSSEYSKVAVIDWYITYCKGRYIDEDAFVFIYIKYDFQLLIREVDNQLIFTIQRYRPGLNEHIFQNMSVR